jgi:hypothetical protein
MMSRVSVDWKSERFGRIGAIVSGVCEEPQRRFETLCEMEEMVSRGNEGENV